MKYYFLDLETTGLDEHTDIVLEVAIVEQNGAGEAGRSYETVVQPIKENWKDLMDPYVLEMHTKNGLIADIDAQLGVPVDVAEEQVLRFLLNLDKPIIAGNSIHFDRRFISHQMPRLDKFLHHRMVDVSSIKLMVEQQWPGLVQPRNVEPAHRAMADALESLQSYRYYSARLNPHHWLALGKRAPGALVS